MGIFASILDKIFHHSSAQASSGAGSSQSISQQTSGPGGAPSSPQQSQSGTSPQAISSSAGATQQKLQNVDVEAVLGQLANTKGGGGNWRTSVVDLLKLLDLDSSLAARKSLAQELNVHAGADGSAEQNIALQKAVMNKIAENGGKVPDTLRH
jgi:uncharacterized protein DUF3597